MYVSSRSQKELAPAVTNWLIEKSAEPKDSEKTSGTGTKKRVSTTSKRKKPTEET
jgi:hypothetical protein